MIKLTLITCSITWEIAGMVITCFDLYSQMLEEAVNEKRGIKEESPDAPDIEVELHLDAYLPAEYIQSEQAKIEIYKKLRKVETEEQLFDVKDELIDRFRSEERRVGKECRL